MYNRPTCTCKMSEASLWYIPETCTVIPATVIYNDIESKVTGVVHVVGVLLLWTCIARCMFVRFSVWEQLYLLL